MNRQFIVAVRRPENPNTFGEQYHLYSDCRCLKLAYSRTTMTLDEMEKVFRAPRRPCKVCQDRVLKGFVLERIERIAS